MRSTNHYNILESNDIIHRVFTPTLGFSIKSQLGGVSTLLNAGKTTNFVYEIISSKLSQNLYLSEFF